MDDWRHLFPELRPPGKLFAALHEGRVVFSEREYVTVLKRNKIRPFVAVDENDIQPVLESETIRLQEFSYRRITEMKARRQIREKLLEAGGNG